MKLLLLFGVIICILFTEGDAGKITKPQSTPTSTAKTPALPVGKAAQRGKYKNNKQDDSVGLVVVQYPVLYQDPYALLYQGAFMDSQRGAMLVQTRSQKTNQKKKKRLQKSKRRNMKKGYQSEESSEEDDKDGKSTNEEQGRQNSRFSTQTMMLNPPKIYNSKYEPNDGKAVTNKYLNPQTANGFGSLPVTQNAGNKGWSSNGLTNPSFEEMLGKTTVITKVYTPGLFGGVRNVDMFMTTTMSPITDDDKTNSMRRSTLVHGRKAAHDGSVSVSNLDDNDDETPRQMSSTIANSRLLSSLYSSSTSAPSSTSTTNGKYILNTSPTATIASGIPAFVVSTTGDQPERKSTTITSTTAESKSTTINNNKPTSDSETTSTKNNQQTNSLPISTTPIVQSNTSPQTVNIPSTKVVSEVSQSTSSANTKLSESTTPLLPSSTQGSAKKGGNNADEPTGTETSRRESNAENAGRDSHTSKKGDKGDSMSEKTSETKNSDKKN